MAGASLAQGPDLGGWSNSPWWSSMLLGKIIVINFISQWSVYALKVTMLSFCKGIKRGQLFLTAKFNQILLSFNKRREEKSHFFLHTASMDGEEFKEEGKKGITMAPPAKRWNKSVATGLEAGHSATPDWMWFCPEAKLSLTLFNGLFFLTRNNADKLGTMWISSQGIAMAHNLEKWLKIRL